MTYLYHIPNVLTIDFADTIMDANAEMDTHAFLSLHAEMDDASLMPPPRSPGASSSDPGLYQTVTVNIDDNTREYYEADDLRPETISVDSEGGIAIEPVLLEECIVSDDEDAFLGLDSSKRLKMYDLHGDEVQFPDHYPYTGQLLSPQRWRDIAAIKKGWTPARLPFLEGGSDEYEKLRVGSVLRNIIRNKFGGDRWGKGLNPAIVCIWQIKDVHSAQKDMLWATVETGGVGRERPSEEMIFGERPSVQIIFAPQPDDLPTDEKWNIRKTRLVTRRSSYAPIPAPVRYQYRQAWNKSTKVVQEKNSGEDKRGRSQENKKGRGKDRSRSQSQEVKGGVKGAQNHPKNVPSAAQGTHRNKGQRSRSNSLSDREAGGNVRYQIMAPPQNVVPSQSGAFVQYYAPADGGNGLQTVTMQPLQTSLAIQQPQVLVSRHALGPQAGAQNHQNGQQHGGQKAKKQRHNKQH